MEGKNVEGRGEEKCKGVKVMGKGKMDGRKESGKGKREMQWFEVEEEMKGMEGEW